MSSSIKTMAPGEVHERMLNGAKGYLVDVRNSDEFSSGHAKWAKSIPVGELTPQRLASQLSQQAGTGEPVYLICESGMRASQAGEALLEQGLGNTILVEGGTASWRSQGLPVNRTTRFPPLIYQTQIAIGILLLAFLAKALLLHPFFYALIALLGVGLIISGITSQCTLTKLLSRLPWNRRAANGFV